MPAFERLPGAVLGDLGVQHFGDPSREQRWLAEGKGLVERSDRAVIAVAGPDRLTWLDSITSQALAALAPGVSTELLVLDPQGRVEHAAGVLDDGETTWLIADAGDAPGLAAWLRKMVFRSSVTVAEAPELAVLAYVAGEAGEAIRSAVHAPAGVPLEWVDPWTHVTGGGHQYAVVDEHPGAGLAWREAIVPIDVLPDVVARVAAGIVTGSGPWPSGLLAAEALRIAAWRPRWATEVDERSLPHEVDWLRSAVHLSKGCYRGQETVAKVHNLGHPPRRLAMLHLDGSDSVLPEPGAEVHVVDGHDVDGHDVDGHVVDGVGGDVVGTVTAAAWHYEDGPIALAILTRRTADDAALTVDAGEGRIAAAQEVIVPADAGATASVPRLPRLGRRPTA